MVCYVEAGMKREHPDKMHAPNPEPETDGTGTDPTQARCMPCVFQLAADVERDSCGKDGNGDGKNDEWHIVCAMEVMVDRKQSFHCQIVQ